MLTQNSPLHVYQTGRCQWIWLDRDAASDAAALEDILHGLCAQGITLEDEIIEHLKRMGDDTDLYQMRASRHLAFSFHASELRSTTPVSIMPHTLELVVGDDFFITVSTPYVREVFAESDLFVQWSETTFADSAEALEFLFYRHLQVVVDQYHALLDQLQDPLEDVEKKVIELGRPSELDSIQSWVFEYSRSLLELRKHISPLRRALGHLCEVAQDDDAGLPMRMHAYQTKLFDLRMQTEHVMELLDNTRGMVANVLSAYQNTFSNHLADISNEMNKRMLILTIITALLAVPSIITGFYGMNLKGTGLGFDMPDGANLVANLLIAWICGLLLIGIGYVIYDKGRASGKRGRRGE